MSFAELLSRRRSSPDAGACALKRGLAIDDDVPIRQGWFIDSHRCAWFVQLESRQYFVLIC